MKKELLDLLICPDDHSALAFADEQLVRQINTAIGDGRIKNRAGQTLDTPLDAALVRTDGSLVYPVIDDIPRMLVDEAILLAQLNRSGS